MSAEERFESKIMPEPNTGCWLWTAGLSDGYGLFAITHRSGIGAHRFSYKLYRGEIPNGLMVCHTCDVRSCVNPDHLFLGTNQDNMSDMKRKGRQCIGDKNPFSKLTSDIVAEIKTKILTGYYRGMAKKLAKEYSISEQTIIAIRAGRRWPHIKPNS